MEQDTNVSWVTVRRGLMIERCYSDLWSRVVLGRCGLALSFHSCGCLLLYQLVFGSSLRIGGLKSSCPIVRNIPVPRACVEFAKMGLAKAVAASATMLSGWSGKAHA
jgi:hypothetical protein